MKHSFFLAFQYLRSAPWRSIVLCVCCALALYLPLTTFVAAQVFSDELRLRGKSTPVLIGTKGNEFDLTMNSLYFKGSIKDRIPMSVAQKVSLQKRGVVVPLYVAHSASHTPLVGTTVEYFTVRQLNILVGRSFVVLGEVVAGSNVAEEFNLSVGDKIRSDMQNLYNIAGAYPMILEVVGILEQSSTQDDNAFFADIKTIWALDGLLHGHDEVTANNSLNATDSENENLEATAAIFMFPELNSKNRSQFHFHGSQASFPLSAVAIFPPNQRDHDILLGEMALSEKYQAVRPVEVVDTVLEIVLRIQQGLWVYFSVLLFSTLAFFCLVLSLSLQLRKRELLLMKRIGGSQKTIFSVIFAEIIIVVAISMVVCCALSASTIQLLVTFVT
jgi:putative ABC transport system permease protein